MDPPRRRIMGVEVPPKRDDVAPKTITAEPTIRLPKPPDDVQIFREEVRRSFPPKSLRGEKARGVKILLSSGAFLTLALGIWQGLPPLIEAIKGDEPEPVQQCATQEAHDALSVEVQRLKEQVRRHAETICDANQGAPMLDFPCPGAGDYFTPREPPPLRRTPRVYPK